MNKSRVIYVAVMMLLIAQALVLALGVVPTGYFDGH